MGPGFPTPYNIIIAPRNRPITDPAVLVSLNRLQKQIAADRTVGTSATFTMTLSHPRRPGQPSP